MLQWYNKTWTEFATDFEIYHKIMYALNILAMDKQAFNLIYQLLVSSNYLPVSQRHLSRAAVHASQVHSGSHTFVGIWHISCTL